MEKFLRWYEGGEEKVAAETMELVMCMDIGSTHTGYAFSSRAEYESQMLNIHTNEEWMSGHANLHTFKVPSILLLRQDKGFHSYGYEAERKYISLLDNKQQDMWYYFKRFLADVKTKQLRKDTVILEEGGKSLNAVSLLVIVLKYLKSHFLEALDEGARYGPSEHAMDGVTVSYIFTVPTKWDNAARECVKVAAKKAGISPVQIFSESEAVGRYCRLVPVRPTPESLFYLQKPNSKHAVVNLGGTTTDTSIQEVEADGNIKEFSKNIGQSSSSTRVDVEFLKFFHALFGSEFSELYAKKYKQDFLELQYEFELKKRQFCLENDESTTFEIPSSLVKMYTTRYKQSIQFMIDDTEFVGRILSQEESLILDKTVMKDIFGPAVKSVIGYLTTLSRDPELKLCDAILIVGGFAESPVVAGAIQHMFPNTNMIIVEGAELAVLKGGVLLGHHSGPDVTIRAPLSYGLGMAVPYNESVHPKSKRFVAKNIQYCSDVFQAHILDGRQYLIGEFSAPSRLRLNRPTQKRIAIPVYVTRHRHTKYTTDSYCSEVGKLYVDILDKRSDPSTVKIQMALLGGSIIVSATDEKFGKTIEVAFNCIDNICNNNHK